MNDAYAFYLLNFEQKDGSEGDQSLTPPENEIEYGDPADPSSDVQPGDPSGDFGDSDHTLDDGDAAGGMESDTTEEGADPLISDSDDPVLDGEDPLQDIDDSEVALPFVIDAPDYSEQLETMQESVEALHDDFIDIKECLDLLIGLIGTIIFLTVFQFCYFRIRHAVKSFTGRSGSE